MSNNYYKAIADFRDFSLSTIEPFDDTDAGSEELAFRKLRMNFPNSKIVCWKRSGFAKGLEVGEVRAFRD